MEPKGISFADVLKNRPKSSFAPQQKSSPKLIELFMKFQRNPMADYTLCLASGVNIQHNHHNNPSRNAVGSRSNVFDSWIQQQFGPRNNKQNLGFQPNKKVNMDMMPPFDVNKYGKGKEPPKVPTNIMANLKKQHSSSMLLNQTRNIEESSINSDTDMNQDVQDPQSSIFTNKNNVNSQKYAQDHINPPFPPNTNLKSQFQRITSEKSLQITHLLTKDTHLPIQNPPPPPSLAQLIASTENIHLQIASMAKKIAQERKILLQDPLLISDRHYSQNRRWEDAKNMVNGYFDKFQKEKPYTEPPSKNIPSTHNPSKPAQQTSPYPFPSASPYPFPSASPYPFPSASPLQVGYSFAAADPPHQLRQNQMIEQISQIQSEQASQRISDSGNFDFVRGGFGVGRLKGEGGMFSRQKVDNLVGDLKMEFDGMNFQDCRNHP